MTTQGIVENVLTVFPQAGEKQIVFDLDDAQKLFCTETGLLETRGSLSSPSSNVAWSLPSDFRELTDVVFYDSDGEPLYNGVDFDYSWDIEFDKFYIHATDATPITGLDDDIDSAYIHYKKIPTTIASRSTALEIEEDFSKAIEHYLLSDYFSKYPTIEGGVRDLNAASWHLKRYERLKVKARRYLMSKDKGSGEGQHWQHAGSQVLPRRVNDSVLGSTTSTQIEALTEIYTKYVRYTLASADGNGAKTATTTMIGYTDLIGTVTSNTFTLASASADMEKDTQILCNNKLVAWIYNSASLITFTFPAGWGTIEIEMYER